MIGWWATAALAGVHVLDGSQITLPVNTQSGTVLQLPEPVRMVTKTTHVVVEQVGQGAQGRGRSAEPVRLLRVAFRGEGGTATREGVTVVLASGEAVQLDVTPGGPGADTFADLQKPAPLPRGAGFLARERRLLHDMLQDRGPGRRVVDTQWVFEPYPMLEWRIVRIRTSVGLTGYTAILRNTDTRPVQIHPEVLSVARPNRLVLVQVDDEVLHPCGSPDGSCETVLRMVVRGAGAQPQLHASEMPFLTVGAGRP